MKKTKVGRCLFIEFPGLPKDCEALRHFEHVRPGGDEVEL